VGNLLSKIDRIEEIYRAKVSDTPQIVFDVFNTQRQRLNAAKERLGEYISPFDL
jgi:phosphoenolpyruvate carboxykinase (GTP)